MEGGIYCIYHQKVVKELPNIKYGIRVEVDAYIPRAKKSEVLRFVI